MTNKSLPTVKYLRELLELAKNYDLGLLDVQGIRIVPRVRPSGFLPGEVPLKPAPKVARTKAEKAEAALRGSKFDSVRKTKRAAEDMTLFGRTYEEEP